MNVFIAWWERVRLRRAVNARVAHYQLFWSKGRHHHPHNAFLQWSAPIPAKKPSSRSVSRKCRGARALPDS